jgi:predicted GNAT family N-acyltransferase
MMTMSTKCRVTPAANPTYHYGSQLMNHAFDVVKTHAQGGGCYGLYLDADAGAVEFYQKLGFVLLEGNKSQNSSPMFIALSAIL